MKAEYLIDFDMQLPHLIFLDVCSLLVDALNIRHIKSK